MNSVQLPIRLDDKTVLRGITKVDELRIQEIVFEILPQYGLPVDPEGTDNDLFDIEKSYSGGLFGVVEFEGEVQGSFGLFKMSETVVELRKMYFDQSIRGKGIAKKLVPILFDLARQMGFQKMELETASSLVEAIGLYQSLGFKEVSGENQTPRCDKSFEINL